MRSGEMRYAVVDRTAPPAWEAIGGADRLLIPAAIIVGGGAVGGCGSHHEAPRIAENL